MPDVARVILLDSDAQRRSALRDCLDGVARIDEASGLLDLPAAALRSARVVFAAVDGSVEQGLSDIERLVATVPGVRVVAYTPVSDVRLMRRVLNSGIDDLLPLPFDTAEVREALAVDTLGDREATDDDGPGPRPAGGSIITVFGAKGGIGKTTIATSLASVLALDTDLSVLVVDMDTRFGDIAMMLNIEPAFTMTDLIGRVEGGVTDAELSEALTRHESGAYVLAAPKHPSEWSLIDPAQVQALVRRAAEQFDVVILDTPGAFTDLVAASIEVADTVLMISSLEVASIKDTVHMLDLLDAEGLPPAQVRLVLNQVSETAPIRAEDVAEVVHREVFGHIPYDARVVHSNAAGRPIVLERPKSAAARELRGLARGLVPAAETRPAAPDASRRLPSLFAPWRLLRRRAA